MIAKAENSYLQSLSTSEVESKVQKSMKFSESRAAYEDAYNLKAEAYDPSHPEVLEAANKLIVMLIKSNEYYDVERYAIVCYECLTRPVDTESEEVAQAAESLARINYELIVRNECGNLEKAESLCRKSLRIFERIYSHNTFPTAFALLTLSDILIEKGNHDDEIKDALQRVLAIFIKKFGTDADSVSSINYKLANFHVSLSNKLPPGGARRQQHYIAQSYCEEAVRIKSKICGPNHPDRRQLSVTLLEIEKTLS